MTDSASRRRRSSTAVPGTVAIVTLTRTSPLSKCSRMLLVATLTLWMEMPSALAQKF